MSLVNLTYFRIQIFLILDEPLLEDAPTALVIYMISNPAYELDCRTVLYVYTVN